MVILQVSCLSSGLLHKPQRNLSEHGYMKLLLLLLSASLLAMTGSGLVGERSTGA